MWFDNREITLCLKKTSLHLTTPIRESYRAGVNFCTYKNKGK